MTKALVGRVEVKSPLLPGGLSAIQLTCARELAKGRPSPKVKSQFGIPKASWDQWLEDPVFLEAIEKKVERFDRAVEETLMDGEIAAAATLVQALGATTPVKGRNGDLRNYPNWEVRLRAAMSLLDRQGMRGRPVERSQQATINFKGGDLAKQLAGALADPAVQQFLQKDPHLAAQLQRELNQLPPPPPLREDVCEELPASSSSS